MVTIGNLGSTEVTVLRAPLVVDATDNTQYRDWSNPTSTTYEGCSFQPFQLSSRLQKEMTLDREWSAGFFRLWMPAGSDLQPTDRVVIHGKTYEIYGEPGTWYDLDDVEDHVNALLYRREG